MTELISKVVFDAAKEDAIITESVASTATHRVDQGLAQIVENFDSAVERMRVDRKSLENADLTELSSSRADLAKAVLEAMTYIVEYVDGARVAKSLPTVNIASRIRVGV